MIDLREAETRDQFRLVIGTPEEKQRSLTDVRPLCIHPHDLAVIEFNSEFFHWCNAGDKDTGRPAMQINLHPDIDAGQFSKLTREHLQQVVGQL